MGSVRIKRGQNGLYTTLSKKGCFWGFVTELQNYSFSGLARLFVFSDFLLQGGGMLCGISWGIISSGKPVISVTV